ncbi:MAG TPA: XTP/dITP diphosphatase [Planctomycetes bacterium]|nr:XTP/dITP diphosphatase [Planctomycetota bacterium]
MTRRLVIATKNPKKLSEMKQILAPLGCEIVSVEEVCPGVETAVEDGKTFRENAEKKALWYAEQCGEICVADDSGLEVDALGGAPGVHSSRYAGKEGDDAANNAKLLKEMEGVPEERRGAQFRCVIAIASPGEVHCTTEGVVRGRILESPRGEGGFGYDPLFLYPEWGATFAEVDGSQKAEVSHRGLALEQLRRYLPSLLSIIENRHNF